MEHDYRFLSYRFSTHTHRRVRDTITQHIVEYRLCTQGAAQQGKALKGRRVPTQVAGEPPFGDEAPFLWKLAQPPRTFSLECIAPLALPICLSPMTGLTLRNEALGLGVSSTASVLSVIAPSGCPWLLLCVVGMAESLSVLLSIPSCLPSCCVCPTSAEP